MEGQNFCLRWDSFQSSITSVFDHLRQDEELVDITLCCEGQKVKAHRMMLSACSPYFRDIIKDNPCQKMVFFMKDTSIADLKAIVEFMYRGSVNVSQSQLASLIRTAELLQISGLSGEDDKSEAPSPPAPEGLLSRRRRPGDTPPAAKRRRRSGPTPVPTGCPEQTAAATPPERVPLPAAVSPAPLPAPRPAPRPPQPQTPPQPPAQPCDSIKVEKVDLTDGDVTLDGTHDVADDVTLDGTHDVADDVTLDATLGYVAEYEGGYGRPDLAMNGFHSRGAGGDQTAMHAAASPVPSQSRLDLGESQERYPCLECGRQYRCALSLSLHRKMHQGLTLCRLCGKVYGKVATLRQHLAEVHRLSRDEVRRIVPTRDTTTAWVSADDATAPPVVAPR